MFVMSLPNPGGSVGLLRVLGCSAGGTGARSAAELGMHVLSR